MADVEDHAAFAGLVQVVEHFAIGVEPGHIAEKHMRADIAGGHAFGDQFVVGALAGKKAEVDHRGHTGGLSCGQGAVGRDPVGA